MSWQFYVAQEWCYKYPNSPWQKRGFPTPVREICNSQSWISGKCLGEYFLAWWRVETGKGKKDKELQDSCFYFSSLGTKLTYLSKASYSRITSYIKWYPTLTDYFSREINVEGKIFRFLNINYLRKLIYLGSFYLY